MSHSAAAGMTCLRCHATMAPDADPEELRAGRLRVRCPAGHARYVDVPPLLTPEQAENDAIVGAWIARARETGRWGPEPIRPDQQREQQQHQPARRDRRIGRRLAATRSTSTTTVPEARRRGGRPLLWTLDRASALCAAWARGDHARVIATAFGLGRRSITGTVATLRHLYPDLPWSRPKG